MTCAPQQSRAPTRIRFDPHMPVTEHLNRVPVYINPGNSPSRVPHPNVAFFATLGWDLSTCRTGGHVSWFSKRATLLFPGGWPSFTPPAQPALGVPHPWRPLRKGGSQTVRTMSFAFHAACARCPRFHCAHDRFPQITLDNQPYNRNRKQIEIDTRAQSTYNPRARRDLSGREGCNHHQPVQNQDFTSNCLRSKILPSGATLSR
jgi:hypothetical protein